MRAGALIRSLSIIAAVAAAGACARAEPLCRKETFEEARYAVCEVDAGADIRLFLNDAAGAPYGEFGALKDALGADGETLLFAMNAGMYRDDRSPVGLYIEDSDMRRALNRADCSGNFCLKPNGIFWIGAEPRRAFVADTDSYAARAPKTGAIYATQSGPMLVIDGAIHKAFNPASESRKYRNGVGVRDGEAGAARAVFVIADSPVTLHAFARFFRDRLGCRDALYLDGSISRLYAPELKRDDDGARMGPIIGVIAAKGNQP